MTSLDKLIAHFERFPGIGSRQARRFAYHVRTEDPEKIKELAALILGIRSTVRECARCFRFFTPEGGEEICRICANGARDESTLMIVEQDSDIQSIERGGAYTGLYFVFGGTVPLLASADTKKLRAAALKDRLRRDGKHISEVILAFSVNPDGENTERYILSLLKGIDEAAHVTVSELGRGLSTGSELEYADPETIKNAFQNRHRQNHLTE